MHLASCACLTQYCCHSVDLQLSACHFCGLTAKRMPLCGLTAGRIRAKNAQHSALLLAEVGAHKVGPRWPSPSNAAHLVFRTHMVAPKVRKMHSILPFYWQKCTAFCPFNGITLHSCAILRLTLHSCAKLRLTFNAAHLCVLRFIAAQLGLTHRCCPIGSYAL